MNLKQGLATGVLAVAIVSSVVLMPVSAESKDAKAKASQARTSELMAQAPASSADMPAEQVRDLTYK